MWYKPDAMSADQPASVAPVRSQPAILDTPGFFGWLLLMGVAIIFGVIDPVNILFQPRIEVALVGALVGAAVLLLGLSRGQAWATAAGAVLLWTIIVADIATQPSALGASAGGLWGPRGLLLVGTAAVWLVMLQPPAWLFRAVLAMLVPAGLGLAVVWLVAPPADIMATTYWLAVDSHGTVYATDEEGGMVWVLDSNGAVQGKLWPRRADPGTPGPYFEPKGVDVALSQALVEVTPTAEGPDPSSLYYCGLATDPQDHLYIADNDLHELRQFDSSGQVLAAWLLPDSYIMGRGCLAADSDHVYLADNRGIIFVYDHSGKQVQQWPMAEVSFDISLAGEGKLVVLHKASVDTLQYPSGKSVDHFELPASRNQLEVPYQAIQAMPSGDIFVTDLLSKQVRHFGPGHRELAPVGGPGYLPGYFSGLGGLAADRQGRLYVSDDLYGVIQRFRPDGKVEAVWSIHEQPGESGD